MREINQQLVWFPKTGPGAALPGTDIRVKAALTFAGEMLTPVQSSVLQQGFPSCDTGECKGSLRHCWLLTLSL